MAGDDDDDDDDDDGWVGPATIERCLEEMGVDFPEGSGLSYVSRLGRLFVRNTPANLDKLETVLASLSWIPTQIVAELRYLRVPLEGIDGGERGFIVPTPAALEGRRPDFLVRMVGLSGTPMGIETGGSTGEVVAETRATGRSNSPDGGLRSGDGAARGSRGGPHNSVAAFRPP